MGRIGGTHGRKYFIWNADIMEQRIKIVGKTVIINYADASCNNKHIILICEVVLKMFLAVMLIGHRK